MTDPRPQCHQEAPPATPARSVPDNLSEALRPRLRLLANLFQVDAWPEALELAAELGRELQSVTADMEHPVMRNRRLAARRLRDQVAGALRADGFDPEAVA